MTQIRQIFTDANCVNHKKSALSAFIFYEISGKMIFVLNPNLTSFEFRGEKP